MLQVYAVGFRRVGGPKSSKRGPIRLYMKSEARSRGLCLLVDDMVIHEKDVEQVRSVLQDHGFLTKDPEPLACAGLFRAVLAK